MDIRETEFVVFDVETTGLSPKQGDRMIEIAALKIKDKKIIDQFETFVNPKREIPTEAQEVNKITPEMVVGAPFAEDVLPKFIQFIGGACLVGHNVKFDLDFVCYELALMGRKLKEETPALDTLIMAKKLMPHLSTYRLASVARSFGIPIDETHRAMADVKITASMMRHLMDLAGKQQIHKFQHFIKEYSVVKPSYKIQTVEQTNLF